MSVSSTTYRANPFLGEKQPPAPLQELSSLVPAPEANSYGHLLQPQTDFATKSAVCRAHVVHIYCAGAAHLRSVSARIGVPVFKLGVTSSYPSKRIEALSNVGYASLWGAAENRASLEALEGAHNWFQIRFPKCEIHNHNNDLGATKIVFQDGHLQLTFLRPVLINRFNEALTTVFAARCLRRFLSSEEGQGRLRKIGADPGAWFHTRYPAVPPHRGPKLSLANELFILNPAIEMPMIFRAIAEMARYIAATEEAGYVPGREYGR